jgi:hypothetical protein
MPCHLILVRAWLQTSEFAAGLILHWFCPQQVAVNIVKDHYVLVAFA